MDFVVYERGSIYTLDAEHAQELNRDGYVFKLQFPEEKTKGFKKRSYEYLGRWEKNRRG